MVSTAFWSDNYVADLDPTEKLLFLYLLTGDRSTLGGIYELPTKTMAVETGIETEMVKKILARFEEDGKIKYQDGWVVIKNFLKHHEQGSPTVKKAIETTLSTAPAWAKSFIGKGIDTLSPSASASASIGVPQEEIVEVEEYPKEKRSTSKYPNARIAFSWMPKYEKSWDNNTTQLKDGELLFERGEKAVRGILSFCIKHSDEPYLPSWETPSKLERNWTSIIKFADRNGL